MSSIFGNEAILAQALNAKICYDYDPQTAIYSLKSEEKHGFSIGFYVLTYEDHVSSWLVNANYSCVFGFSMNRVDEFALIGDVIRVIGKPADAIIKIEPYFSICFFDKEVKDLSSKKITYDPIDALELFGVLPEVTETGSIFRLENMMDKYQATFDLGYKKGTAHITFGLRDSDEKYIDAQINGIEHYAIDVKRNLLTLAREHDQFNVNLTKGLSIEQNKREFLL